MYLNPYRVAILVPTKGRPEFIKRMLAYYESLESSHPIYIGDASSATIAAEILDVIEKLKITVKYFHWEGVGTNQTIYSLAQNALADNINYCAIHGDDDFFVPASLHLTAEFLHSNTNYMNCQGRGALFTLDQAGPKGRLASIDDYWGVNELESESALERLKYFVDHYYVLQFSTHRTAEFVEVSTDYAAVKNDSVGELLHCYSFALSGRSKFLDCLYLFRQSHAAAQHPLIWDWLLRPEWGSDIQLLINSLSAKLLNIEKLSYSDAEAEIKKILKIMLQKQSHSQSEVQGSSFLKNKNLHLRKMLPRWLKLKLRQIVSSPQDLSIINSKKSIYYDKFIPVLNSLCFDNVNESVS